MKKERIILVFLKFPEKGKVKTRLAKGVGEEKAVEIYDYLVGEVVERLPKKNHKLIFMTDPEEKYFECKKWIESKISDKNECEVLFRNQFSGNLGERLLDSFKYVFKNMEVKFCAVIGTDCPDFNEEVFNEVDDYLNISSSKGLNGMVLGPTYDGGYYLLAVDKFHKCLFKDIPWSTEKTCSETLKAGRKVGLDISLLKKLNDIDEIKDWEEYCR